VLRLHELCGNKFVSAGRPLARGLFRSVALVVCLMRKNVTQDFTGAVFLPDLGLAPRAGPVLGQGRVRRDEPGRP
jgi:hypothetical protein